MSSFFMGSRNPNLGPHASMAAFYPLSHLLSRYHRTHCSPSLMLKLFFKMINSISFWERKLALCHWWDCPMFLFPSGSHNEFPVLHLLVSAMTANSTQSLFVHWFSLFSVLLLRHCGFHGHHQWKMHMCITEKNKNMCLCCYGLSILFHPPPESCTGDLILGEGILRSAVEFLRTGTKWVVLRTPQRCALSPATLKLSLCSWFTEVTPASTQNPAMMCLSPLAIHKEAKAVTIPDVKHWTYYVRFNFSRLQFVLLLTSVVHLNL